MRVRLCGWMWSVRCMCRGLYRVLSFSYWQFLYTGTPFPQCAHWGLPLVEAALRGKDCGKDLGMVHSGCTAPLAPLLGELAAVRLTEGSPELKLEQKAKESVYPTPIVGDGPCAVP